MRLALLVPMILAAIGCAAADPSVGARAAAGSPDPTRPRVIVTSDFPPVDVIAGKGCKSTDPREQCSDPDDVQSMVRFLLYSNDLEVEALVASAGSFANIARKRHILNMLDRYDQVDENLRRHDPRYPTADYLRSVTWQGQDGSIGTEDFAGAKWRPIESLIGPEHDTEASEAIIRIVDEPDPRPVWILVWGGPREAAQAIWKVTNTRSPEEARKFISKIRFYIIVKQDYTVDWMLNTFPELFIILSEKNYQGMFWSASGADTGIADSAWVEENIRQGHGPLGAAYPRSGWDPEAPGIWEGDSPSFLHVVSGVRGVSDPERPDMGGWGGKFVRPDNSRNHWFDDPAGPRTVYRWRPQVQAEFKQRADWMLP